MIVVCTAEYKDQVMQLFQNEIQKYKLEIQEKKTTIFYFEKNHENRFVCYKYFKNGQKSTKKRLEYLGFEFDGEYTFLKSSSLSKFYRRMKEAIDRGKFYSKHSKYIAGRGQIFQKRLYKKFSYLYAKRKTIWKREKENPYKWKKTNRHNWGNFMTYAYMAHYNMTNSKIKHQIRRHWLILNQLIIQAEERLQ